MNYAEHYSKLISKGIMREFKRRSENVSNTGTYYEQHHILPLSQGGLDDNSNLVKLTPKEHYLAHLLLWKMGEENEIFSVECFLNDSINPRRPQRYGQFHWKRWLRKAVAYQRAKNVRAQARINLCKRFNRAVEQIDAVYVETLLEIATSDATVTTD